MEWVFSDGTVVRLGGEVEGASLFAQHLRSRLSRPDDVLVFTMIPETIPLQLGDPLSMSVFLQNEISNLDGPQLVAGEFLPRPVLSSNASIFAVH